MLGVREERRTETGEAVTNAKRYPVSSRVRLAAAWLSAAGTWEQDQFVGEKTALLDSNANLNIWLCGT